MLDLYFLPLMIKMMLNIVSLLEYNIIMHIISLLLSGFSIFYSVVLILMHLSEENREFRINTHYMGVLLLVSLIGLQFSHFLYLHNGHVFIDSQYYLMCLFLVAPAFYFYARPLLKADNSFGVVQLIHFMPVFSVYFLGYELAFSLAFVIGSGYLLWLLKTIYALKSHRNKFRSEMVLLAFVFLMALFVSVMALTKPVTQELFISLYASAVGLALFMVALVISFTPKITEDVAQAARETYAVSTLTSIDCDSKLAELHTLMHVDKLYQQNNLDLQTMATELQLSSHQLSELINSKLAISFSRYLRNQRINAAKKILLEQPKSSVLSIGLEVGFSSQSNFYEAFKEITGSTPGKFRKTQ